MKKSVIIVLQIISLLLMISNHYLVMVIYYASYLDLYNIWFFGVKVSSLITDICLYITVGIQLTIIVLIIEEVRK